MRINAIILMGKSTSYALECTTIDRMLLVAYAILQVMVNFTYSLQHKASFKFFLL